jgi:hypothetical protein
MKSGIKKSTLREGEKLPSLLKNEDPNSSRIRSGKLKPLNEKLLQKGIADKQNFLKQSS